MKQKMQKIIFVTVDDLGQLILTFLERVGSNANINEMAEHQ